MPHFAARAVWSRLVLGAFLGGIGSSGAALAANHLDTPTVIADPRADIGDIFAWMSPDGQRLNLVMTIVGHSFSDKLKYVFHIDSGRRFGRTTSTTSITCRFSAMTAVDCSLGEIDHASGDPSNNSGLLSQQGHMRIFAGLRDDPFFNNVKGFRAGYDVAAAALRQGVPRDAAACPLFDSNTSKAVFDQWHQTAGGPAQDFLTGWTPSALVISVDRAAVARGGSLLAIWAVTANEQKQLDRMGRPLTENALLATLGPAERANELKEQFNLKTPATSAEFVPEIEAGLSLYDGLDANCGNQLLADRSSVPQRRYRKLAELLADDRLWVNSAVATCSQFFAVELAHAAGRRELRKDCGGRTITDDAIDVYRSLLVMGTTSGVSDGVDHDGQQHSLTEFPFLAPPPAAQSTASY